MKEWVDKEIKSASSSYMKVIATVEDQLHSVQKHQRNVVKEIHIHERQLMNILSSGNGAHLDNDAKSPSKVSGVGFLMGEDEDSNEGDLNQERTSTSFEVMKMKAAIRRITAALHSKVDREEYETALYEKADKEAVAAALKRKVI